MAPPPLPLRHYAPTITTRQVTEDTPPDLLEGSMDLQVTLPSGKTVLMNVHRSTPMMDLLIQVTTAHRINPGGHIIQVISDNIFLSYKPSTPIGTLETSAIKIVPKNKINESSKKIRANLQQQAIERNIRLKPKEWVYKQQLLVNLPKNQLAVYRVSPKTSISEILSMVCKDKNLDEETHEIRHPVNVDERLRASCSLSDYQLQEVCVVTRDFRPPPLSVTDLITMSSIAHPEDKKRRGFLGMFSRKAKSSTGDSSVSSGSAGERSASPARSDESLDGRTSSVPVPSGMSSTVPSSSSHKSPGTSTGGSKLAAKKISRPVSLISLSKNRKRTAPVPPEQKEPHLNGKKDVGYFDFHSDAAMRSVTYGSHPNIARSRQEEEDISKAIYLSLQDIGPNSLLVNLPNESVVSSGLYASSNAEVASDIRAKVDLKDPIKVRALYDFEAADDSELTFREGEIIIITEKIDGCWWKGTSHRGEGLIPASFVTTSLEEKLEYGHKSFSDKSPSFFEVVKMTEIENTPESAEETTGEINEDKINMLIDLLCDADLTGEIQDDAALIVLEAQVNAMAPTVNAQLESIDRKHLQASRIHVDLLDALNMYHQLMRDMPPAMPYYVPFQMGMPDVLSGTQVPPNDMTPTPHYIPSIGPNGISHSSLYISSQTPYYTAAGEIGPYMSTTPDNFHFAPGPEYGTPSRHYIPPATETGNLASHFCSQTHPSVSYAFDGTRDEHVLASGLPIYTSTSPTIPQFFPPQAHSQAPDVQFKGQAQDLPVQAITPHNPGNSAVDMLMQVPALGIPGNMAAQEPAHNIPVQGSALNMPVQSLAPDNAVKNASLHMPMIEGTAYKPVLQYQTPDIPMQWLEPDTQVQSLVPNIPAQGLTPDIVVQVPTSEIPLQGSTPDMQVKGLVDDMPDQASAPDMLVQGPTMPMVTQESYIPIGMELQLSHLGPSDQQV